MDSMKEDGVVVEIEGDARSTWFYVCGECHSAVDTGDKYCHECGRRIIWDDGKPATGAEPARQPEAGMSEDGKPATGEESARQPEAGMSEDGKPATGEEPARQPEAGMREDGATGKPVTGRELEERA